MFETTNQSCSLLPNSKNHLRNATAKSFLNHLSGFRRRWPVNESGTMSGLGMIFFRSSRPHHCTFSGGPVFEALFGFESDCIPVLAPGSHADPTWGQNGDTDLAET